MISIKEIAGQFKIDNEYIKLENETFYINTDIKNNEPLKIHNFGFTPFENCYLYFYNCQFVSNVVEYPTANKNFAHLTFIDCEFLQPISLHKQNLPIDCVIEMKNCTFYKKVIIKKVFNENVYFTNSTFKEYADFSESEFKKNSLFLRRKI